MKAPFFSIQSSYDKLRPEIFENLNKVFDKGEFINGSMVRELEESLERYTGVKHAVAVGNATDALVIMLKAAGIQPNDEVIVPCYTFFASASSIAMVGAVPVFVDIDPDTYAMIPEQIEEKITKRTKAIMPVHLFSQLADMPKILEIAKNHDLLVLEDSAEAIGMWCDGVHAGGIGKAGVISFFPTKTLGAVGDAGALLTNDDELATRSRLYRGIGMDKTTGMVMEPGYESYMDDVQAAYLLSKLQNDLEGDIKNREKARQLYNEQLAEVSQYVKTPRVPQRGYSADPVFYVYLIEAENRDGLKEYLKKHNIGFALYYPSPLHLQPCFKHLGHQEGDMPNAEKACKRNLALPLYGDITEEEITYVCNVIKRFYKEEGHA